MTYNLRELPQNSESRNPPERFSAERAKEPFPRFHSQRCSR